MVKYHRRWNEFMKKLIMNICYYHGDKIRENKVLINIINNKCNILCEY